MNDEPAPNLEFDPHEFAEYAIESHEIRQILRRLDETHNVMELGYEEVILEGNLPTHDRLFEFVGVEPMRADWLWERKFSPPPESYIENYDQLTTMHGRIKRELKEGAPPEDLYNSYGRSLPGRLWKKATFWGRRPGYAMFRVEQRVRDAFGLRSANENSRQ
jgi:nucleotidyltransferase/DNA polymerase involved in DNA repair